MDRRESPGPSVVLASLYLAGAPFPNLASRRGRWGRALTVARAWHGDTPALVAAFRAAGLWDEAAVVAADPGWAAAVVGSGAVLTAACGEYPSAWRNRLGSAAPPAVWRAGLPLPVAHRAWLGVVGSRRPSPQAVALVGSLGPSLPGWAVVSGGAPGVDQMAASSFVGSRAAAVELLPCGLAHAGFGLPAGSCRLSCQAPSARFSAGAAMERNALVYAFGGPTVVVQPRLRMGGTWRGAVEALRRRLGVVAVWTPPPGHQPSESDAAAAALVRLGAEPFAWDAGEGAAGLRERVEGLRRLHVPTTQPSLFGAGLVRESSAPERGGDRDRDRVGRVVGLGGLLQP